MLKFAHLIMALTAAVAVPLTTKPNSPDSQVPLCENSPTPTVMEPDPPIRNPIAKTVFRVYIDPSCNTADFLAEYDLVPGRCYNLPGTGGNLLFHKCGQCEFRPLLVFALLYSLLPHQKSF